MDEFFTGFNDDRFTYNPKNQAELEFVRLRGAKGWSKAGKACRKARRRFFDALVRETKSPVHAFFVGQLPYFNYDSLASPKVEFQRVVKARGWKKAGRRDAYECAKAVFEGAFEREFDGDLDRFFKAFKEFDYNPRNQPKAEFRRLTIMKKWRRESVAYENARDGFFSAFAAEFDSYFGTDEDDIKTWESLCKALGVYFEPVPPSITQCKRRLEDIYVNIYDLLHHVRTKAPFDFFKTERELRVYTDENDLRFPKAVAKAGPLKFILRFIDSRRGRPRR